MSDYITPVIQLNSVRFDIVSSDSPVLSSSSLGSSWGINNNPALNNPWKSSWFNSKGQWYNFTGNIFQTTNGTFNISIGSLKFGVFRFTNKGFQVINARIDLL